MASPVTGKKALLSTLAYGAIFPTLMILLVVIQATLPLAVTGQLFLLVAEVLVSLILCPYWPASPVG